MERKTTQEKTEKTKTTGGITLIALIITIIVMLILVAVTVQIMVDSGLFRHAQDATTRWNQAQMGEQEQINMATDEIEAIIKKNELPSDGSFSSKKGVNTPKLVEGMTPIKWDSTANEGKGDWVTTEGSDLEWYDYSEKKWANVITSDGSMWVWIPRFAYTIANGFHQAGVIIDDIEPEKAAGTIEIEFLKGTSNEGATGKHIIEYNEETTNNYTNFPENGYVVHPAFTYDEELTGIWVAKFEASPEGATNNSSESEYNGIDKKLQIKPGVASWRGITIGNAYSVCLNYNAQLNSHLMKNTEWGACAYLSKSKYGKNVEEVWINNSSNFITGATGNSAVAAVDMGTEIDYTSAQGQKSSTTGTVYGIYDMNGGAWEYVAAYVNNEVNVLTENGLSLINGENHTKDIYSIGEIDYASDNYKVSYSKYGDAVFETSSNGNLAYGSWYGDYSLFPYENGPFFIRSGASDGTSYSGLYCFVDFNGSAQINMSFRPVLSII